MTEEQINIAIAESLGCKDCHAVGGLPCGVYPNEREHRALKKYTASLDACAEFEAGLKKNGAMWVTYCNTLALLCGGLHTDDRGSFVSHTAAIDAPAGYRCESYLRTIGKWEASA